MLKIIILIGVCGALFEISNILKINMSIFKILSLQHYISELKEHTLNLRNSDRNVENILKKIKEYSPCYYKNISDDIFIKPADKNGPALKNLLMYYENIFHEKSILTCKPFLLDLINAVDINSYEVLEKLNATKQNFICRLLFPLYYYENIYKFLVDFFYENLQFRKNSKLSDVIIFIGFLISTALLIITNFNKITILLKSI